MIVQDVGSHDDSSIATPTKQRQRHYTEKETRLIHKYFASHISKGESTSLHKWSQFLMVHPMQRSDKKIQDKVKGLLKLAAYMCFHILSIISTSYLR